MSDKEKLKMLKMIKSYFKIKDKVLYDATPSGDDIIYEEISMTIREDQKGFILLKKWLEEEK